MNWATRWTSGSSDSNIGGICVGFSGWRPFGIRKPTSWALSPWQVAQLNSANSSASNCWNTGRRRGTTTFAMYSPRCSWLMSAQASCASSEPLVEADTSGSSLGVSVSVAAAPPQAVRNAQIASRRCRRIGRGVTTARPGSSTSKARIRRIDSVDAGGSTTRSEDEREVHVDLAPVGLVEAPAADLADDAALDPRVAHGGAADPRARDAAVARDAPLDLDAAAE